MLARFTGILLLSLISVLSGSFGSALAAEPCDSVFGFSGSAAACDSQIRRNQISHEWCNTLACTDCSYLNPDDYTDCGCIWGGSYLDSPDCRESTCKLSKLFGGLHLPKCCLHCSCLKRRPPYLSPEHPIHTPYEALNFYYYDRPYQYSQSPVYRQDNVGEQNLRENMNRTYEQLELTNAPVAGDATRLEFADLR